LLPQTSIAAAMLMRERSGHVPASVAADDGGVAQPAASLEDALRASFANAGVIFVGEVLSIDRTASAVIVRWRVDDAVRGVNAVGIYEQKEWPGLWANGDARYAVGERALVLLHAASVAGFASPIGDGVIPLRGDTITGTLDLRWLSQQVAVTDAARLRPVLALLAAGGNFALSNSIQARIAHAVSAPHAFGLPSLSTNSAPAILTPPTVHATDDANAHVDGAMILGMLHAWHRAEMAGR
jgi:hypothetical protein